MVIKSKLIPPQSQKAVFYRPRLQQRLSTSPKYDITLIHAGTGFGKTTTLVELSRLYKRIFWYNITEPDRDPTLFLAHLLAAFLPSTAALMERFEKAGGSVNTGLVAALINQLTTDLEEDAVLILDDFHLVSNVTDINTWLEQLVEQRPPHLRFAIACRQIPETPAFIRWRVKGNVLVVDQSDLSFTQEEILSLFSEHYQFPISAEQAQVLFAYTDGWIIALQMIWQRLQTSRSKKLENILAGLPSALADIFNFLAQEVLLRQTEEVQRFLVTSAVLRQMDAGVCNALLESSNSQETLQTLNDRGLFLTTTDNLHFRYQRLFQDFLTTQLKAPLYDGTALHRRAARHYAAVLDHEEAVFHWFCAGEQAEAALLIESIGPKLLELGRLRTLAKWIEQLNEQHLEHHPKLQLLLGDVLRLRSKFEDALVCYNRAEKTFIKVNDPLGRSEALRSKAQIYLDTIRPLKASSLLEEAVVLLEPQEHPVEVAALLDQLAENKLNQGKPAEARALHKEANLLRNESDPDDIYLEARALLRTGNLQEAAALLESSVTLNENPATQRPQRFHREMPLLLSLVYLMLGDVKKGEIYARQGIEIGRQLDSPFVEAVGLMRLGHAHQLQPQVPWRQSRLDQARICYEKAIELVRPFNVMRVQVEPLWGLCRFHGYQGNVTEARRFATQAIEIAETSGDRWFVGLLGTTMGTAYALAGNHDDAQAWLARSHEVFNSVGDIFGQNASASMLALNDWMNGSRQTALATFAAVASNLREHQHGFVNLQPSLLGIQDDQVYYPLLIKALSEGIEKDWIGAILKQKNLETAEDHPGYGLGIRCLGPFEVWRGSTLISARDWQREKARQLLQFLVNGRGRWFSREQIIDRLWPHLEGDAATQNLKVALNALNRALEPDREPGMNPFFIQRRDTLYGLNPSARVDVDVDDFTSLCRSEEPTDLEEALKMYVGEYMGEISEDHWANDNRERYREQFLSSALRLADKSLTEGRCDAVIKLGHDILAVDNCNEPAFRLLMKCHAARGNRSTVQAVYQRCRAVLREDLDVEPSPETTRLFEQLSR